jgi:CoA-transferase family III
VQPETRPLHGYAVVELSTGIASAYCTKLLADGGAHVIKVESPQGDPLRRWSASGADIEPGDDGALFSFLTCSKHSVVADPGDAGFAGFVSELLARADAVVWSRGSAVADCDAFTPAALRRSYPHLIVTSITPFGLEGPWRDRPAPSSPTTRSPNWKPSASSAEPLAAPQRPRLADDSVVPAVGGLIVERVVNTLKPTADRRTGRRVGQHVQAVGQNRI